MYKEEIDIALFCPKVYITINPNNSREYRCHNPKGNYPPCNIRGNLSPRLEENLNCEYFNHHRREITPILRELSEKTYEKQKETLKETQRKVWMIFLGCSENEVDKKFEKMRYKLFRGNAAIQSELLSNQL